MSVTILHYSSTLFYEIWSQSDPELVIGDSLCSSSKADMQMGYHAHSAFTKVLGACSDPHACIASKHFTSTPPRQSLEASL